MTQRERHTPDGGAPHLAPGAPQRSPTAPSAPPSAPAPLWEEWYHRASPDQRRDLLALALRQGLLYASQLPSLDNSPPARRREAGPAPQVLLPSLLNGPVALEPFRVPELAVEDSALDETQRQAVARALATPDLCLIQGVPGTGKSRLIAEVVRQATLRGERVLLLAPTPPALDRVLERLGCRETLCPLRLLAPDESPEALPACVRRLTPTGRLHAFQEQTLPAARAALAQTQAVQARHQARQGTWAHLEELAARHEEGTARMREVEDRRAGIAAAVEAELERAATEDTPAGFGAEWVACLGRHGETRKHLDARLAVLQEEVCKQEAELRQVESDLAGVRPLAEALRGRRWWTGTWWRAFFRRGEVRARCADLERDREIRRAALDKLEQERAGTLAEQAEADRRLAADRQRLAETESTRRRAACDAAVAALAAEQDRDRDEWARAVESLDGDGLRPANLSAASVAAAREAWSRQREQHNRQEVFARQWLEAVEEAAATLPEHLAGCANVVAATTAGLAGDAVFGGANSPVFDLLVLDEAHQVTESEATAAARRARRWLLVGEPPLSEGMRDEGRGMREGHKAFRPHPSSLVPHPFFHRLWQQLHAEPRRLPYAWTRRGERLVCSLRPIAPDQERCLETEPVADRPDVELRILVPPRSRRRGPLPAETPRLAEVTFPAATPIEEAKAFIFRELEELPVQADGHGLRWVEQPDRVVLELAAVPQAGLVAVPLEEGVREMVGPDSGNTAALEFDRAAGWTAERAERWVGEHLGLRDLGRTTRLATSYRAGPSLACFLSDLLFGGTCEARPGDQQTAVEFVAVPPLSQDKESRRHGDKETPHAPPSSAGHPSGAAVAVRGPRLRGLKGGAGLEVDLADARPLEQLPAEVRAALPRRGLVNYLEARAVVRQLEALLADADFQAAGLNWQRQRAALCEQAGQACDGAQGESSSPGCANGRRTAAVHRPTVAVMALWPAQVELLRWLVRQVPALADGPLAVEVGLPAAFRQRECLAALVSLTRSHTHRATSYGDGPHSLVEALTRPASRLVLFGDPATLARRSQWQGPLDHLDEAAARVERGVVARLVAYLQGHGSHPHVFRLLEGSFA